MRRACLPLLFLSLACPKPGPAPASVPVSAPVVAPSVQAVQEEVSKQLGLAKVAREAGDFPALVKHYEAASGLSPNNPDLVYLLARGYALAGQPDRALPLLERLASMGLAYRAASHPDLASLRDLPRLQAVAAQMEANQAPLDASQVFAAPPGDDLLLEGITHDPKTGRFFVGSVRQRTVFQLDAAGQLRPFLAAPAPGLWGALGMVADPAARVLWVCSSALPPVAGLVPEDAGKSGLFRFDLDTGALTASYLLPNDRAHGLGDVLLTPRGDVLVSDSVSGEVFRLAKGDSVLRALVAAGSLRSPQGMALSADGESLYLADYAGGLFRLALASGALAPLPAPETVPVYGIDGLLGYRGDLLVIQNGVYPARVSRLRLSKDGEKIEGAEVLERGPLAEPTLGAVVGDVLYFVGTSQWTNFNGADLVPAAERLPAQVRRLALKP